MTGHVLARLGRIVAAVVIGVVAGMLSIGVAASTVAANSNQPAPEKGPTSGRPAVSWNDAVSLEQANGEYFVYVNEAAVVRLMKDADQGGREWSISVKIAGKSTFIIPFAAVKTAYDIAGDEGKIELATESGSFALPLSVLGEIGGLDGGGEIRLAISPSDAPDDKLASAARRNGLVLLDAPAVAFSLTVDSGGVSGVSEKFADLRVIADFGDTYVERSFPIGREAAVSEHMSVFRYHEDTGSFQFVPSRFVNDSNGIVHAVASETGNGSYVVAYKETVFRDIGGHWERPVIAKLAAKGLINGTMTNKFQPNRQITRAEFASMLVRGLGLQNQAGVGGFSDVEISEWYAEDIGIAYAKGLVAEGEGLFRPTVPITRQEMAVMLANAMRYANPGVTFAPADLVSFPDWRRTAEETRDSIRTVVGAGILSGVDKGRFAPESYTTRAQAAVIVDRLLRRIGFID